MLDTKTNAFAEARKKLGLSLLAASRLSGVKLGRVAAIEKLDPPEPDEVRRLGAAYGVSAPDLLRLPAEKYEPLRRALTDTPQGLRDLVERWLPHGVRHPYSYVARNPHSASPAKSLSVNLLCGSWVDFISGDHAGDPITLFAFVKGIEFEEAADLLAADLGIEVKP